MGEVHNCIKPVLIELQLPPIGKKPLSFELTTHGIEISELVIGGDPVNHENKDTVG